MNSTFNYKSYLIKISNEIQSGHFSIDITLDYKNEDMLIALENCFNADIFQKYYGLFLTNSIILNLQDDIKKEIDRIENKLEKNKIFF